ncbi:MAG: hypothetical protein KGL39_06190 [Patescibacteria group bacterium]|nr:hypothetical protein [Patescibacteria group bacterium]
MATTDQRIDAGADALRRHEQGGRILRPWLELPIATKRKWREKAEIVLRAADANLVPKMEREPT